jgi:hypothetical protein
MRIARVHGGRRSLEKYGRARLSRPAWALLVGLRAYAIGAVLIAVYSFFRALH